MLAEARAGVGELTKEEVIQRTLESEENERNSANGRRE